MHTNKKNLTVFILAGIVAYSYYRFNRMSISQKTSLKTSLKETGKKLVDGFFPDTLKDKLAKKESIDNHPDYGKV